MMAVIIIDIEIEAELILIVQVHVLIMMKPIMRETKEFGKEVCDMKKVIQKLIIQMIILVFDIQYPKNCIYVFNFQDHCSSKIINKVFLKRPKL
ncbi:unnamed protein product [Paramecium octaurelia]|uniref:Uncharacterized protein n=1 Tax=Paramecium octaurelia TaxID=43137 RepID=A0A8S1V335_PAROT|nr:unnamed protein product [Paramecium octaurelia]